VKYLSDPLGLYRQVGGQARCLAFFEPMPPASSKQPEGRNRDDEMTKTITITAAVLFSAAAQAGDSYQQFTAGNPDIRSESVRFQGVTAVQPGVGSDIDRYHGVADGNADLFSMDLDQTPRDSATQPEIYGPSGQSPDLSSTAPPAKAPT